MADHAALPFTTLHKAIFDTGTDAGRPSVPEGVGDAYFASDTEVLYLADAAGTAWVAYGLTTSNAIFSQTADSVVEDTTSETTLFGTGDGSVTLPADALAVGSIVHILVTGHLATKASSPGSLIIKATLGGTEIVSRGPIFMDALMSDNRFEARVKFVCRATGASGAVVASGRWEYDGFANGLDMVKVTTTTIDTTGTLAIDITAEWSLADVANILTIQMADILYQKNVSAA